MSGRLIPALLACALLSAAPAAAGPYSVPLKDGPGGPGRVMMSERGEIWLEVRPLAGEGYSALTARVTGNGANWRAVHRANGGPVALSAHRSYKVPLALLADDDRAAVLGKLWPHDRYDGEGWAHKVTGEKRFGRSESLWQIAALFTGEGNNWKAVRSHNGLRSTRLRVGQVLIVPGDLLREEYILSSSAGAATEPHGPYRITTPFVNGELEYGQDDGGPYAAYRLGTGEALYSAVVVRFTGRVDADDVNAAARIVAERSGIRDVTDIPVGYPVKIPLDLLTPEYLPPDHPRRISYEKDVAAGRDFARGLSRTSNLMGVTVILDAGHGGVDVGASNHTIWEDDYAYDVYCRVKKVLEERTRARVVTTIKDPSQGYRPHSGSFSSKDQDEVILTSPLHRNSDPNQRVVGVHLRWYLSNYHYRRAIREGAGPDQVVFTSFHADSLHSSVHGAMVYIPGADYRSTRYGKAGSVYTRYREVRDQPTVRFSRTELVRSEGLSRAMAESVAASLERSGIAVHPHTPVRNHVVRSRRAWVPAVLRYNQVPTSLLVEVCNLNNRQDQKLLKSSSFRQRFAEAYVEGLVNHFEKR